MPQNNARNNTPTNRRRPTQDRRGQTHPASHGKRPIRDNAPSPRTGKASGQHVVTPRANGKQGVEINLPGGGEVLLTRRHFLYGVAGVAAIAALGGGYSYLQSQDDSGDIATLSVPESAVFTSDDCTLIEDPSTAMALSLEVDLPYGSLVWANGDSVAACLLPTETSKPLAQIGLLALGSGVCTTVVANAVGESEGFEIYDVRACDKGIVWTEADILEGAWRVYHATTDGASIGAPVLAEEGDSDWEMPTLAAAGGCAFWQLIPKKDGKAKSEDSKLKRAAFGSSSAEDVYVSHGRMACAPYSSTGSVVIAPRADTAGTYYQLTCINADTGKVSDAIVLPASMKPFEVAHGETGFSFSFEGIYDYGDGIANLGTYTPASAVQESILANAANQAATSSSSSATAEAELTLAQSNSLAAASTARFAAVPYGGSTWFRFPRTPSTAPAWCGKWFIVKSTRAVCGIDLESKQYFTLDVENGADTYGDFLATSGTASRLVTFSNIDHTPLGGQRTRKCLVRVWSPLG